MLVRSALPVSCSKAAKIIMLSNNKLDAMSEKQKFSLLLEETGTCADWHVRQFLLQLTDQDVEWVTCVASYRAIYRMVSLSKACGCCIMEATTLHSMVWGC